MVPKKKKKTSGIAVCFTNKPCIGGYLLWDIKMHGEEKKSAMRRRRVCLCPVKTI